MRAFNEVVDLKVVDGDVAEATTNFTILPFGRSVHTRLPARAEATDSDNTMR
jgi:hypothetical protein